TVISPSCARLEYAITARRSGARNAKSDPQTNPQAASTRIGVRKSDTGPGNVDIAIRRNPSAAAFDTPPDSTPATSADDSLYASGSQPWNGNSGAFTANAAANPRKIHELPFVPDPIMSNVPCES